MIEIDQVVRHGDEFPEWSSLQGRDSDQRRYFRNGIRAMAVFLYLCHEQIGYNCHPEVRPHCIFRVAPQGLYDYVLFDPFVEYLNIPPMSIQASHLCCTDFEVVRDEYLEVPAEALRETVLNALCHRQYERYNLTIGIAIYDDRIEIENPGILPPQITPENILQPHISYPYNPLIANVLYSTTYIENWGSGVKRIMEACQKRGVAAPIWSINGGFVVVTFMRPAKGVTQSDTQDGTQGGTQDGTQDNNLDKWIENRIRENPQITTEELAKMSKKGLRTIKRHIAKMPHIRYVGSGYSGHWEVLDKE